MVHGRTTELSDGAPGLQYLLGGGGWTPGCIAWVLSGVVQDGS